jgi:hypothetical protein
MPQPWPIPADFSGKKFATRYAITRRDFFIENNALSLTPGVNIPDDPPIFEPNDPTNIAERENTREIFAGTPTGQLVRALSAVMVQEINTLRAAVVPPLPPRTLQQLKNAIINRIDDGTAD